MIDIRIEGAEQLAALAKRLKQVGDKELRRELMRGIQRSTKPLRPAVQASARSRLPQRGGLAAEVGAARVRTRTRTAGEHVGVRVEVSSPRGDIDMRAIDRGRLRHPVFGHRDRWVTQRIDAGVISDPLEDQAPQVRREVLAAMESVAEKITRGR